MEDKVKNEETKDGLKKLFEFDKTMDEGHKSRNYHVVAYTNGELLEDDREVNMELYDIDNPESQNIRSIKYEDGTWTYKDEGIESMTIKLDKDFQGYKYTNVDPYAMGSDMYQTLNGRVSESRYSYPFVQQLVNFIQEAKRMINSKEYESKGLGEEGALLQELNAQADRLEGSIKENTEQLAEVKDMITKVQAKIAAKNQTNDDRSHEEDDDEPSL